MAAIDDQIKSPEHAPTIGLLLCKTKNDQLAEYALGTPDRSSVLPTGRMTSTTLPPEFAAELPSIEELEAELAAAEVTTIENGDGE